MGHLALFLVLTASISSSTAFIVIADSSYCVHLRCEWRGVGKHCKPANSFRYVNQHKIVSDGMRLEYPLRNDDESETSILARIQALYPVNTFTVVNDVGVGEKCEGKRLWCNGIWMYVAKDYKSFLKLLQKHAYPPKLQC